MARKIPLSVIYYAAEQISAGRYIKDVAREVGYSYPVLSKRIKEVTGIVPCNRSRPTLKLSIPTEEVLALYQQGMAEKAIAEHFKCSRPAIRRRLLNAGINIRSSKEACTLWMSKTTKEFRQALTRNAHNAIRGVKWPIELRKQKALLREKSGNQGHLGLGEAELCSRLNIEGIPYTPQKAVNVYNIDIAIESIAVELTSLSSKYQGRFLKERKRIKDILDSGYTFIFISISSIEALVIHLDNIIALINQTRRLPAGSRQNWVIRCYENTCTVTRNKLGQFTSVPTPKNFFYEASTVDFC